MFLACIGMSWVGVKMQQARRQKEAVEAIKKLGGTACPMTIRWIRQGMGYRGHSHQAQNGCEVSSVTTSLRMLLKYGSTTPR